MAYGEHDEARWILRREREARGWSRERVEDLTALEVTVDALKAIELGRRRPTMRTLRLLADLYGLALDDLAARLADAAA